MTIGELYDELIHAYSVENLNRISLVLISLYRDKQYAVLRRISEMISDCVTIEIRDDGKGFSGFMKLYHPDRAKIHHSEISKLRDQNNFDALLEYSHILKLERIDEMAAMLNSFEDIDYSPVYEWDIHTDGFRVFNISDPEKEIRTKRKYYTFYNAFKIREYGNVKVKLPSCYLEELEEIELASSDINDLDGIQLCIHARSIDVSDNRIYDLLHLSGLSRLEELNLSDNEIEYIDSLGFLKKLKSVDLSNNKIKDISPLFRLENLEYVSLAGNPVDTTQIEELAGSGVNVDY